MSKTVLHTLESRQFYVKSGQIQGNFHYGAGSIGIIDTLRLFGQELWFGYMSKETYLYRYYLDQKANFIRSIVDLKNSDAGSISSIAFAFFILRLATSQTWKFPALFNRDTRGHIEQMTGRNRALASIMTYEKPWQSYPILFVQPCGYRADELLEDGLKIENDAHLNEILGLDFDSDIWQPSIQINFSIVDNHGYLRCVLEYVGDGHIHDHDPKLAHMIFDDYRRWHDRYQLPAKLKVYTQWPELLLDSLKIWDVEIVGSTEGMLIDDRMGYAERTVHQYHNSPIYQQEHVLWVVRPRLIDLSDLLPWMDMTHSTYISSDWSFIVYKPQDVYKNTFINVSRQEG